MHFSMNIISITAVAALLLASIESAESMMRLFGNRRGEVVYQGKTISKKDAFGLSNLELVKVISQEGPVHYLEGKWGGNSATVICPDLNQPEGKIVQSFYNQHHLPINSDRVDYRAIQGVDYFGYIVATPSPSGKQCYVIDNACKYTYEQHVANLSKMVSMKEESFDKTLTQIVAALIYAKVKGFLYIIHPRNMCFDAYGELLILQHYGLLIKERATAQQQLEVYSSLRKLLFALIRLAFNNQIDPNTLNTQVNNIIKDMRYPMPSTSTPPGSRRGSISATDPVPPYVPPSPTTH